MRPAWPGSWTSCCTVPGKDRAHRPGDRPDPGQGALCGLPAIAASPRAGRSKSQMAKARDHPHRRGPERSDGGVVPFGVFDPDAQGDYG